MHWEWRGFGTISQSFRDTCAQLEKAYPDASGPQKVEDIYFWVPELSVNLKVREGTGTEDGLKIKRLLDTRDGIEKWLEDPDEIYLFPLGRTALNKLWQELAKVGIELPDAPAAGLSRAATLALLTEADSEIREVKVKKERDEVLWRSSEHVVKIEIAEITSPRNTVSVGLENWTEEVDASLSDAELYAAILAAKRALEIDQENLKAMSYLEAIGTWASEGRL